jgi:hypothetical protein
MRLRRGVAKKYIDDQLHDMERKTGYDIQDKMYGWFLRRSEKYNYTVRFQDVNQTNALLKQAGVEYGDLPAKDRSELARILGVDAVIQDRTAMDKPMSTGAAVAVAMLVGFYATTNRVATTINIHDGKSENLLWKYDYEASGTIGSSTDNPVNSLLRNASKKFPYRAS